MTILHYIGLALLMLTVINTLLWAYSYGDFKNGVKPFWRIMGCLIINLILDGMFYTALMYMPELNVIIK